MLLKQITQLFWGKKINSLFVFKNKLYQMHVHHFTDYGTNKSRECHTGLQQKIKMH